MAETVDEGLRNPIAPQPLGALLPPVMCSMLEVRSRALTGLHHVVASVSVFGCAGYPRATA